MAKTAIGLGQFRGKVGGVVFSVSNGEQVAKAYQPVVANPRTSSQLRQRAKMNLAGKISAIVRRDAINALGENNRMRRAAFLSNLMRNSAVVASGNDFAATIDPRLIVFSKGSSVPVVTLAATLNGSALTISATKSTGISEERYNRSGMRYVVLGISNVTGEYDFSKTGVLALPAYASETAASNTIQVLASEDHAYLVYGIPFDFNEGYGVSSLRSGVLSFVNNNVSATTEVNESAAVANYGASFFAAQIGDAGELPDGSENGNDNENPGGSTPVDPNPNPGTGGGGSDLEG